MPGPELEFAKMASHAVHPLLPLVVGGGVITRSGVSEAAVEFAFNPIRLGSTQLVPPQGLGQQGFRSNRGIKGLCIVACQEASLQLGDPIPELAGDEVRLTLKMRLYPKLVESFVIQRTEPTRQATEVSDERHLHEGLVGVVAECRLPAVFQPNFRFPVGFSQRLARPQHNRDQTGLAHDGRVAIAALVAKFEGCADKGTATRDVSRPRHEIASKKQADETLKPPQPFARD